MGSDGKAASSSSVAIGIDLGTTYSCVAVWRHDRVEIIANDQGNRITPSYVAFTDTHRMIGDAAKNQLATNASNTVFDSKRLIGRKFSDPHVQNDMTLWPFQVIANADDIPGIVVEHKSEKKSFTAEEISAMILTKMREIAERFLRAQVKNAVITVPAYFNDSQRQATKDAGTIAGLNVLSILNEPSAAAIAYGLDTRDDSNHHGNRTIFVFDFGGGTLDLTLLTIDKKGNIEVKIHGGDTHLGGEDFDAAMVEFLATEFQRKKRIDLRSNKRALCRLKVACERAKRILSSTAVAPIDLDSLHQGLDFYTSITLAKFEEISKNLFERCMELVHECFADANVEKASVDEVVLVGGSTRILKLEQLLKEFFDGKDLFKSINADEAVAYGAAIHASKLSGAAADEKIQDLTLWEVTPLSLGLQEEGDLMKVIVPRNTMVPTKKEHLFTTRFHNRNDGDLMKVQFHIYEGERKTASYNNLLGSFDLEIPRERCGVPVINVCFEIDSNGILHVSAEEKVMGVKKKVPVESNKGRLSGGKVEKMVKDAEKYKAEDEEHRKKVETRNKLENLAYNMRNVVSTGSKISAEDKERINNAVDYALKWVGENDFATLDEINEVGKRLSSVFHSIYMQMYQVHEEGGGHCESQRQSQSQSGSQRLSSSSNRHKTDVNTISGVVSAVCSFLQVTMPIVQALFT